MMNTTTYYASGSSTAPTPYLANVVRAVRALLKALFPVRAARPVSLMDDRIKVLRLAESYRCSAPSLSQELTAIAYRDC